MSNLEEEIICNVKPKRSPTVKEKSLNPAAKMNVESSTTTGTATTSKKQSKRQNRKRITASSSTTPSTTLHKRKRRKINVRFSPKKETYIADNYDRTPPPLDVYDCDGCGMKILEERYHCKLCDDFDICKGCATGSNEKVNHIHNAYDVVIPSDDDADDELAVPNFP